MFPAPPPPFQGCQGCYLPYFLFLFLFFPLVFQCKKIVDLWKDIFALKIEKNILKFRIQNSEGYTYKGKAYKVVSSMRKSKETGTNVSFVVQIECL